MPHMSDSNPTEESDHARSNFIQGLVQHFREPDTSSFALLGNPPRRIVQFWNDVGRMPRDVRECIETWRKLERQGFELILFDELQARDFIRQKLGSRYIKAYDACYHPAMQSDYFRLCYIFKEGGCYIDTDDVYHGSEIGQLFINGLLKIQPLCYDTSTGEMVPPSVFTELGANDPGWIFYFNKNPLIASRGHPIVKLALSTATNSLLHSAKGNFPDIQSTTGPGNLTKSIFDAATADGHIIKTLHIQCDWGEIAISKWPLSYRDDLRNWRLSNGRDYDEGNV